MTDNLSYSAIGRIYGVSGNAIKKACKKFDIPTPAKRKINSIERFDKNSKIDQHLDTEFKKHVENATTWKEIALNLGYNNVISSKIKRKIEARCSQLNIDLKLIKKDAVASNIKGK